MSKIRNFCQLKNLFKCKRIIKERTEIKQLEFLDGIVTTGNGESIIIELDDAKLKSHKHIVLTQEEILKIL